MPIRRSRGHDDGDGHGLATGCTALAEHHDVRQSNCGMVAPEVCDMKCLIRRVGLVRCCHVQAVVALLLRLPPLSRTRCVAPPARLAPAFSAPLLSGLRARAAAGRGTTSGRAVGLQTIVSAEKQIWRYDLDNYNATPPPQARCRRHGPPRAPRPALSLCRGLCALALPRASDSLTAACSRRVRAGRCQPIHVSTRGAPSSPSRPPRHRALCPAAFVTRQTRPTRRLALDARPAPRPAPATRPWLGLPPPRPTRDPPPLDASAVA